MAFFSSFYDIEVRDEIAREFTDNTGQVDDMLAGLHEIRARMAEKDDWLKTLRKVVHASRKKRSFPKKSGRQHEARPLQTA